MTMPLTEKSATMSARGKIRAARLAYLFFKIPMAGGISMISRLAVAAALFLAASAAGAQAYPTKPISLIVPFPPGGGTDGQIRNLATAMGKQFNQTVLVENVPGASSTIGSARVAKAAPNGYTILSHNTSLATARALIPDLQFNPLTDFDFIGLVNFASSMLVARSDFPGNNFKEFLAYIRANQHKVTLGEAAGPPELFDLLFMHSTGTRLMLVPYKGGGPALNDLMGKHLDLMSSSTVMLAPFVKSGKVKAIGVTARSRVSSMPDVPTLDEQGLTGFDMVTFQGLFGPKNLPQAVLDRLVSALQGALLDPDFVAFQKAAGAEIASREQATPAGLRAFFMAEVAKWEPLINKARGELKSN